MPKLLGTRISQSTTERVLVVVQRFVVKSGCSSVRQGIIVSIYRRVCAWAEIHK